MKCPQTQTWLRGLPAVWLSYVLTVWACFLICKIGKKNASSMRNRLGEGAAGRDVTNSCRSELPSARHGALLSWL